MILKSYTNISISNITNLHNAISESSSVENFDGIVIDVNGVHILGDTITDEILLDSIVSENQV